MPRYLPRAPKGALAFPQGPAPVRAFVVECRWSISRLRHTIRACWFVRVVGSRTRMALVSATPAPRCSLTKRLPRARNGRSSRFSSATSSARRRSPSASTRRTCAHAWLRTTSGRGPSLSASAAPWKSSLAMRSLRCSALRSRTRTVPQPLVARGACDPGLGRGGRRAAGADRRRHRRSADRARCPSDRGRGDGFGRRPQHHGAARGGRASERDPRRREDLSRHSPRDRLPRGESGGGEGKGRSDSSVGDDCATVRARRRRGASRTHAAHRTRPGADPCC